MQTGGGSMDLRSEHQDARPGLARLLFKAVPQKLDQNLSEHKVCLLKRGGATRLSQFKRQFKNEKTNKMLAIPKTIQAMKKKIPKCFDS